MERKTSKRGLVFLVIGLLLLFLAGGWYIYNIVEDSNAGKQAADLLDKLEEQQEAAQNENSDSSVLIVEGDAFCGKIIIDKFKIELPVYDEWNYTRLTSAPCRYAGSIATDDIIIAAHNYKSHFGSLNKLQIGDKIQFIDACGTTHTYLVDELLILDGTAVSDMHSGGWDFTLFTCTKGGEQRVTVRCQKDQAD